MIRRSPRAMLLGLLVLLGLLQVLPADRTNPQSDPNANWLLKTTPSVHVQQLLIRACFDCHSDQTRWPWYSTLNPAGWIIADDVQQGRRDLNFSRWAEMDRARALSRLQDICELLTREQMPPALYRLAHAGARLNPQETAAVCAWTQEERARQGQP